MSALYYNTKRHIAHKRDHLHHTVIMNNMHVLLQNIPYYLESIFWVGKFWEGRNNILTYDEKAEWVFKKGWKPLYYTA